MPYHWKEGWYFSRQANGDVAFWNLDKGVSTTVIDHDSWLSIIACVSLQGETAAKFQDAATFHDMSI